MFRIRRNQMFQSLIAASLALCVMLPAAFASEDRPAESAAQLQRAQSVIDQLPLYFEINRGQFDQRVRFFSRSPGHALFLTGSEAVLTVGRNALAIGLKQANPEPAVEGLDRLRSFSSYFIGKPENWRERVEHYSKVRYRGVYPGIDLVYYGQGQRLEHDFVVSPGADPSHIRMLFRGATALRIDDAGDLVVGLGESELRFSAPYSYTESSAGERREVASRFVLKDEREVGFALGDYNARETLVIDPVLLYGTFIGGSNVEIAKAVAVDEAGHIYVTGITVSPDYPTFGVGLQPGGGDELNAFLMKLDPLATAGRGLLYSGYFGGVRDEEPFAIRLDAERNVYIVGATMSGDFPTTPNAVQPTRDTIDVNGFLVKFNVERTENLMLYGTYLAGKDKDVAYNVRVDQTQKAYVVGRAFGEDFPLSADPLQPAGRGGGDAFFSLIDTVGGGLIYSTLLGGTSTDWAADIVIANADSVFITGFTASNDFPVKQNPYGPNPFGRGDAFLTRIDWRVPGLEGLGYSGYLGGSDLDVAQNLVLDPSGVLHIGGYTLSKDFPTTAAAVQRTNAGDADIFIATLDTTKAGGEGLLFSTYIGGSNADVPYMMRMDSTGGLVTAGYTLSDDFPIVGDSFDDTYSSLDDGVFLRIDPSKPANEVFTCSSYLGGDNSDIGWGMTLDDADNLYITGSTVSDDFPVSQNAFTGKKPGIVSGFVSKISPCAPAGNAGVTTVPRRVGSSPISRKSRAGGGGR